jgi:hypothetical protein
MESHFVHAGVHQVVCDAFAVTIARHVQPLDFAWGLGHNAAWRLTPTELSESHQPFTMLAQQGDHVRVVNFVGLDPFAETPSAVERDIFSRIHSSEGVPERLFSDRSQLLRVVAISFSYDRQSNLGVPLATVE